MRYEKNVDAIRDALDALKLRDRKNIERKMAAGEVKYDQKLKKFVQVYDEEKELNLRLKDG